MPDPEHIETVLLIKSDKLIPQVADELLDNSMQSHELMKASDIHM